MGEKKMKSVLYWIPNNAKTFILHAGHKEKEVASKQEHNNELNPLDMMILVNMDQCMQVNSK
mgnify:FL=1